MYIPLFLLGLDLFVTGVRVERERAKGERLLKRGAALSSPAVLERTKRLNAAFLRFMRVEAELDRRKEAKRTSEPRGKHGIGAGRRMGE